MITTIVIILVTIVLAVLTILMVYPRDKDINEKTSKRTFKQKQIEYETDHKPIKQIDLNPLHNRANVFEGIISIIKNRFEPTSFENDEDCEKQLINFLTANLPSNVITRGHTTTGERIVIVIDGTYALELIIANNEEKLLYLMNLTMQSKKDFDNTAAVIIDIGAIPAEKIQEFSSEIKKIGIKTIVIQANYEPKEEIETTPINNEK